MAFWLSSDLRAKFKDDVMRIARKAPFLRTIMPSRTSLMGTNSWVALGVGAINLIRIYEWYPNATNNYEWKPLTGFILSQLLGILNTLSGLRYLFLKLISIPSSSLD